MQNLHFKIAILTRGQAANGPVADLVNQISAAGISKIYFFELHDAQASRHHRKGIIARFRSLLRLINDAVTDGVVRTEIFLLNYRRKQKNPRWEDTISSIYRTRKFVQVYKKEMDGREYVDWSDMKAIAHINPDILVQIDSPQPPAGISNAAKFGLLELIYSPATLEVAPRPGFWTSYYRKNKTEFQIRHYQHGIDSGTLLLHGSFATKLLFSENYQSLVRQANAQLVLLILKIVRNVKFLPRRKERGFDFACASPPGSLALLAYIFKSSYRVGRKFLRCAFNIKQKWSLALTIGPWVHANERDIFRIEPPPGKFWADPFLFEHSDQLYCFVEEYDYKTKKGHISVLSIKDEKAMKIGSCLEKPFHLSFPYIFRYEGNIYMCPEASESNEITIYRSQMFPLKWNVHSTEMSGIAAADTMIFEFDGKWWMFTNIDTSGTHDYCSALHIFYSDKPVHGSWNAHAMNPVIVDSRGGRNGGLIIQDGRIFRGAQVQGYDQYGQRLIVSEIVLLNEFEYVEAECKEFAPIPHTGLVGVHHISTTGNMTVVDQLTSRFKA